MRIPWFKKKKRQHIAITKIEGIIADGSAASSSREEVIESIKMAEDYEVKALIVRINSPGGTVGASQEIYQALKKVREKGIPVIASFGDVAASGGVYVAMAANKIISNPGTITGSIGVIIKSNNLTELYNKIGVSAEVIKSGEYKDILASYRSLTPEERELLQETIDDTYLQFVEAVAEGRGLSIEQVKQFADGRIFSGRQAKNFKLVDELGDLQTAINVAKQLAGIEGEPKLVHLEPEKSWREIIFGSFSQVAQVVDSWQLSNQLQGIPLWLMPKP
ncbi:MAG: signal peptide peptidase SppA [Blastocatellia bacterium]|nr:signal peptide peptidase SppA [Blastocatellia bacterium]